MDGYVRYQRHVLYEPLKGEDKPQFALTWEGIQYTFNCLPQGYKHSPTIAHNALAALLDTVKVPPGIRV